MNENSPGERFWEIDFFRGIAICLMVFYHLLFDLHYFYSFDLWLPFSDWKLLQTVTGSLFLTLVGISAVLKLQKLKKEKRKLLFFPFLKRSLFIWLLASLLTLFTYRFIEGGIVLFGILHLIALSLILSYPFLERPKLALFLSAMIILVNPFVNVFLNNINYMLPLGGKHINFSMIDYYPVLPWFAFVLFGIFAGNALFQNSQRRFSVFPMPKNILVHLQTSLGRYSLFVYFIHQPIIFFLLGLLHIFV